MKPQTLPTHAEISLLSGPQLLEAFNRLAVLTKRTPRLAKFRTKADGVAAVYALVEEVRAIHSRAKPPAPPRLPTAPPRPAHSPSKAELRLRIKRYGHYASKPIHTMGHELDRLTAKSVTRSGTRRAAGLWDGYPKLGNVA